MAQYLIEHHGFKKLHLNTKKGGVDGNGPREPSKSESSGDSSTSKTQISYHPRISQAVETFEDVAPLLDFVTKSWRSRWVITSISNEAVLDALSRRPFFILLSVDAPLTVRWQRHQHRSPQPVSLEDFVAESDADLYSPVDGAMTLMSRAAVR